MKKTLILLSLIYLVSCEMLCMGVENPKNNKDCFNRRLENEKENVCCFLKTKMDTISESTCAEMPNGINQEFLKKMLDQYSEVNYTIEELSCPTKEKEDDISSKLCEYKAGPKESKDCFSSTLSNEKSTSCCYVKASIDGISQSICRETTKELSAYDLKRSIIEEIAPFNGQLDEFICPS